MGALVRPSSIPCSFVIGMRRERVSNASSPGTSIASWLPTVRSWRAEGEKLCARDTPGCFLAEPESGAIGALSRYRGRTSASPQGYSTIIGDMGLDSGLEGPFRDRNGLFKQEGSRHAPMGMEGRWRPRDSAREQRRQREWTESLAVGRREFVERMGDERDGANAASGGGVRRRRGSRSVGAGPALWRPFRPQNCASKAEKRLSFTRKC